MMLDIQRSSSRICGANADAAFLGVCDESFSAILGYAGPRNRAARALLGASRQSFNLVLCHPEAFRRPVLAWRDSLRSSGRPEAKRHGETFVRCLESLRALTTWLASQSLATDRRLYEREVAELRPRLTLVEAISSDLRRRNGRPGAGELWAAMATRAQRPRRLCAPGTACAREVFRALRRATREAREAECGYGKMWVLLAWRLGA